MPAGFLLAEDAAVKARFSGLTVSDNKNQERPVKVFFRYPEGETEKEYPFITIENISLDHARDMQHSESQYYYDEENESDPTGFTYFPSEQSVEALRGLVDDGEFLRTNSFVPIYLVYQITTYTRSALHDRQMTAKMLRNVVPFRYGFIEIPEDGTMRRFDLLGWTQSDLLDQESGYRKRIFRKVYTLRMNAEIPVSDFLTMQGVETIIGEIVTNPPELSVSDPDIPVNNPIIPVPIITISEAF